jgi:hypothetical protein
VSTSIRQTRSQSDYGANCTRASTVLAARRSSPNSQSVHGDDAGKDLIIYGENVSEHKLKLSPLELANAEIVASA